MRPALSTIIFYGLLLLGWGILRGSLTPFPAWIDAVLSFIALAGGLVVWALGWRATQPAARPLAGSRRSIDWKQAGTWLGLTALAVFLFLGPMSWIATRWAGVARAETAPAAKTESPRPAQNVGGNDTSGPELRRQPAAKDSINPIPPRKNGQQAGSFRGRWRVCASCPDPGSYSPSSRRWRCLLFWSGWPCDAPAKCLPALIGQTIPPAPAFRCTSMSFDGYAKRGPARSMPAAPFARLSSASPIRAYGVISGTSRPIPLSRLLRKRRRRHRRGTPPAPDAPWRPQTSPALSRSNPSC